MPSVDSAATIALLLEPPRIYTHSELERDWATLPTSPGIYGWYFVEPPPGVPTAGCVTCQGLVLLYVGTASKLHRRIRQHFRPRGRSTLRRTLGVLLEEQLSLVIRPRGTSFDYGYTEERISDWMSTNARVAWAEHPAPKSIERLAIQTARPPLNLHHNTAHSFHPHLSALRDSARDRAHGRVARR